MIRFAHSEFLWIFWLSPLIIGIIIYTIRRRKLDRLNFSQRNMLSRIAPGLSNGKMFIKAIISIFALLMLFFTIVDPQIGTRIEEVKREGVDIMLVVDVSASMTAEDIKPSRLKKTKHSINTFIDKLKGDRIGIVAFAGAAFLQCPLTLDYSAAKMFTDVLDTNLIPVQGTALAEAMTTAIEGFVGETNSQKVMVVITDGEDHEQNIDEAIKSANEKGIIIYAIGMGSPAGSPIPSSRGYLQDRGGSVILSKLNETLLSEIALETGGGYYRASPGEDELDKIYNRIFGLDKTELSAKQYTDYEDRFQFFAGAALFLLLIEILISEKRGAWARFFKVDE